MLETASHCPQAGAKPNQGFVPACFSARDQAAGRIPCALLLYWSEECAMSDGREEREEQEKRREQEERENREDRIDRESRDQWEQERVDS